MDAYIQAKASIFKQQTSLDYVVLNYEDELVRALAAQARSQILFFSTEAVLVDGVFIEDGNIYVDWQGQRQLISPLEGIQLRGRHNLENILCAVAMAWIAGVAPEHIESALMSFQGVRHRLEEVADFEGVLYINDSKGTNPDSTIMALRAFTRPIILIAGGRPKGGSYDAVAELISKRVKALVLLGEAKDLIKTAVLEYGFTNIYEVDDFPAAVQTAHRIARNGDVVLLSPACASWDMFPSYEHRGDLFCELVAEIIQEEPSARL
jgi:UDP-N-acetylmuramoylalanine--D-glutamate ligase